MLQIAILGLGAWLILRNELSPGGMIAASVLVTRALAPVDQAITSWRGVVAAFSASSRIKTLLGQYGSVKPTPPLPAPKGTLVVDQVSYKHPGEKELSIRGISFDLEPGQSLGLLGPTAAGKTTLARLLVGTLKPVLGNVRLDGADLADWDARDRGQYVGYLPQDIELFNGTVRDNIARMAEADPDTVYWAAHIAGMHEQILALPQGYETVIGAGGVALSGGQRQRIGLARAVYGEPRLIVLDEPNSNLDQEGEAALVTALRHLKEANATVVVISHRSSVLRHVDKLLVLREGRVHRIGLRDEVFAELTPSRGRVSQSPHNQRDAQIHRAG